MKAVKNCLFCLKTIFHYVPFHTLAAAVCLFVPAAFTGLQVLVLQRIVDRALECARQEGFLLGISPEEILAGKGLPGTESLIFWGMLLVALLILGSCMQRIGTYQMELVNLKLMERMAPDIAGRLTELEYASFEARETQELFQKMSGEPENGIFNCSMSTFYLIQKTITLGSSMAVIFSISPWIGLGIVLVGIPMMVLGYYAAGYSVALTEESVDARRRMGDLKRLLTDKHAMYEMKLFDAKALFLEKWERSSGEYAAIALRENASVMKVDVASRLLNVVYLVFVVGMAAAGLLGGSLTLGQFAAALNAVSGIGSSLHDSSRHVTWLMGNAMEIGYYMDFLKLETRGDLGSVETLSHYDIAFENVSFRYPGTERDILKNVTFYIKEGERIAFVGENGAGKSTVVKLLCGLYEPTAGNVTIGGVPVRELSPGLRIRCLSVVFQDFQAYQLTLRENVAFGCLDALRDDGKLMEALGLAGGEELVLSQEKGLDRNLGKLEEDGQDLSKGQWQRVAMARAFVSRARYVVLDEPTASLDPLAESHMYENFARIFRERGTILISHRLASARMADKILVLDGGRVVQRGSHEELMEKQGLYRTMYLAQSSFYQEGGRE